MLASLDGASPHSIVLATSALLPSR
jgi:hypothetical protein